MNTYRDSKSISILFDVGKRCAATLPLLKSCALGKPPGDMSCEVFVVVSIIIPIIAVLLIVALILLLGVKSIRRRAFPHRDRENFASGK